MTTSEEAEERARAYGDQAAVGVMTWLADNDWNFWLSKSTGRMCMQIGHDPAGLSQATVMAIVAVLHPHCERVLANLHADDDRVQ
jgi:hypothetical protein